MTTEKTPETFRVQKLLAQAGVASRRKSEDLIVAGKVKVNGKTIEIGATASWDDKIECDGQEITKPNKIYLIFNKPDGVMSSMHDPLDENTLDKYIPPSYVAQGVSHVGRLDNDAEGLLVLTNDGDYANRITHPRYQTVKTYEVWTDQKMHKDDIADLEAGIKIDNRIVECKVEVITRQHIKLSIHVGMHKVVKRLLQEVGYRVTRLKRTQIGNLNLGSVKSGQFREISSELAQKAISE